MKKDTMEARMFLFHLNKHEQLKAVQKCSTHIMRAALRKDIVPEEEFQLY